MADVSVPFFDDDVSDNNISYCVGLAEQALYWDDVDGVSRQEKGDDIPSARMDARISSDGALLKPRTQRLARMASASILVGATRKDNEAPPNESRQLSQTNNSSRPMLPTAQTDPNLLTVAQSVRRAKSCDVFQPNSAVEPTNTTHDSQRQRKESAGFGKSLRKFNNSVLALDTSSVNFSKAKESDKDRSKFKNTEKEQRPAQPPPRKSFSLFRKAASSSSELRKSSEAAISANASLAAPQLPSLDPTLAAFDGGLSSASPGRSRSGSLSRWLFSSPKLSTEPIPPLPSPPARPSSVLVPTPPQTPSRLRSSSQILTISESQSSMQNTLSSQSTSGSLASTAAESSYGLITDSPPGDAVLGKRRSSSMASIASAFRRNSVSASRKAGLFTLANANTELADIIDEYPTSTDTTAHGIDLNANIGLGLLSNQQQLDSALEMVAAEHETETVTGVVASTDELCRNSSASSLSSNPSTGDQQTTTEGMSDTPPTSRKPSFASFGAQSEDTAVILSKPPPVADNETPQNYVDRMRDVCARSEIGRLLANYSDQFHMDALAIFMATFSFADIPIDIALRKLLMEALLPKETQQIDRVIQAFAERYHSENSYFFTSPDQAYLVAFSLIMLHTDAFNKNNKKHKMTKAEYTRNTRSDNILPEVLEYLYDNTVYCAYTYVDARQDITGQPAFALQPPPSFALVASSNKDRLKSEVYGLIESDNVRSLRPKIEQMIPFKNPFSFTGTVPFFNSTDLHKAFMQPHTLFISTKQQVPITKIGHLVRRDEVVENKRPVARKWKEFSVILTGSQLLFLKDVGWAAALNEEIDAACFRANAGIGLTLKAPDGKVFKPESVVSLHDCIALYDFSFTHRSNSFVLVVSPELSIRFQAQNNSEMNDWIALINYAATFKTAGIIMRQPSSRADFRLPSPPQPPAQFLPREPHSSNASTMSARTVVEHARDDSLDNQSKSTRIIKSAQGQTIGTVEDGDRLWDDDFVFEQFSHYDMRHNTHKRKASRSDILQYKIRALEDGISSDKAKLQSDLHKAKCLALLRPFSAATRKRIQATALPIADRIRETRLSLAKSSLQRDVLARDLLSQERDIQRWQQAYLASVASNGELQETHSASKEEPITDTSQTDAASISNASTQRRDRSLSAPTPATAFHSILD